MIDYSWREELSEALGKVSRPVAEIHMKDKHNNWRAITMYIDSGADISIISRSFGELFGHHVEKGRKIRLKGISAEHLIAYIHKVSILIGKSEVEIEIAIATSDNVPNILGRQQIFNLFEIQFKNKKACTRFI